jgi:hypothetical protein
MVKKTKGRWWYADRLKLTINSKFVIFSVKASSQNNKVRLILTVVHSNLYSELHLKKIS